MSIDTLTKYGSLFQTKVLASLLSDRKFLERVYDIINPNDFDSETNQWIAKTIVDYFKEYRVLPTPDAMKFSTVEIKDPVRKQVVYEQFKQIGLEVHSFDLESVKDQFVNFVINQNWKNSILRSVELMERGDYDQIKTLMKNTFTVGMERDLGMIYKDELGRRLSETLRHTIETPWDVINYTLDGGLAEKELGIFMAPAGIGKSWLLISVGANAVKQNKNVLHYSLELSEDYVGLRYDAHISGFNSQNIKMHKDEVETCLRKLPGNLIIKDYPTKTATIDTITSHIEQSINYGFKPDMIIVDYGDLIKGSRAYTGGELRHELANIFEDLRGLAGIYECPVWTATQANRSALEADAIGAEFVSEAYSKIMIADFIMSLSRKDCDKSNGTGRVHIVKNRFGRDGFTLPCRIDLRIGLFNIFDENTNNARDARQDMRNGNKTILQTQFNGLMENVQINGMG